MKGKAKIHRISRVAFVTVVRRQSNGPHVYCGAREVTFPRLCSVAYNVLFQTTLKWLFPGRFDHVPNTLAFVLLDFSLAPLVRLSWVRTTIVALSWGSRDVYVSTGSAARVCCYRSPSLTGSAFEMVAVTSSANCFWLVYTTESIILSLSVPFDSIRPMAKVDWDTVSQIERNTESKECRTSVAVLNRAIGDEAY